MSIDGDDDSSMVVSRPSKKWMRSGTALEKASDEVGGRRVELLLLRTVCMMMMEASDGQLRLEANYVLVESRRGWSLTDPVRFRNSTRFGCVREGGLVIRKDAET